MEFRKGHSFILTSQNRKYLNTLEFKDHRQFVHKVQILESRPTVTEVAPMTDKKKK